MDATTLVRNEWIKLKKRPATLIAVGVFAFVSILGYGSHIRADAGALTLPEGWRIILASAPQLTAFVASVLLILLVANEFDWQTARQNVIDGLSREEWFGAKVLLIPVLLVVFLAVQTSLGLVFSAAGDGLSPSGLIMRPPHLRALGGLILGFFGYTSLALAIATAVRGAGAAIGVLFLYMLLVEQLLASVLVRLSDALAPVVRHFPLNVFDGLMRYLQWDSDMQAALAAAGRTGGAAELWDTPHLLFAALAWIALLIGGSYLVFRRRDL